MLFGNQELQEEVLEQAQQYAKREKIKLIFGAMVGSISKGLHYADSDYDTRFLYLREDFPEKVCIPSEMKEEELVKRYYPKDKVYEWIPFWEATSFLQFLVNPSFKNDFSVGLYNIVGWTFGSPYIWDPYGLQSKLMPLINTIFCQEYEVEYHKKIIEKYIGEFGREKVIAKSYMYSVHAAATIEWSIKYNNQPPIYLQTLLHGIGKNEIWKNMKRVLEEARKGARDNHICGDNKLHGSHFTIMTTKNEILEEYVCKVMADVVGYGLEKAVDETKRKIVNDMYEIIYDSVFGNEELKI